MKASFPDELESWLNTGNYYYDIGSLNKAIEEYKIAIEKYEDSGEAHSLISQVYSYNEQMELALEHAQMAIDLEPTSDNYYNMGNLYMDETKYLEATTFFYDQAIEVSEGFYDTYRSNKMYAYYLDHRYMKCIEFGLESLKVFPDSYDINWILGYAYQERHDYENSSKYIQRAIDLVPESDYLLYMMAENAIILVTMMKLRISLNKVWLLIRRMKMPYHWQTTLSLEKVATPMLLDNLLTSTIYMGKVACMKGAIL